MASLPLLEFHAQLQALRILVSLRQANSHCISNAGYPTPDHRIGFAWQRSKADSNRSKDCYPFCQTDLRSSLPLLLGGLLLIGYWFGAWMWLVAVAGLIVLVAFGAVALTVRLLQAVNTARTNIEDRGSDFLLRNEFDALRRVMAGARKRRASILAFACAGLALLAFVGIRFGVWVGLVVFAGTIVVGGLGAVAIAYKYIQGRKKDGD